MKVLANRYLFKFSEIMPESVQVDLFDPKELPDNVTDYDAVFVNTTTPLNEKTLPETGNISFVATGSSGTDHLDLSYLNSKGISTGNANGCNAVTVAEYVITAILATLETEAFTTADLKTGVIGVGAVGTEVSRLLSRFSISSVLYDPPRAERDPEFNSAYFAELKECNILTFHTPLTIGGQYPTHHMLNESWLGETDFHMLINSARGGIIDEDVTLRMLNKRYLKHLIVDTWENEPEFNPIVADAARFATPHIAGYSIQSKRRATEMIIRQFCEHAGMSFSMSSNPSPYKPELKESYSSLKDILLELHPLGWFDQKLRDIARLDQANRGESFSLLRSEAPLRHEYSNMQIEPHHLARFPELEKLGIRPV